MLNLIYAMKIFGHRSVESFRRELSRNSQLRIACGLSEGKYKYCGDRKHLVPPARVFTGFLNKLKKHRAEIEEIKEGAKRSYLKRIGTYFVNNNICRTNILIGGMIG